MSPGSQPLEQLAIHSFPRRFIEARLADPAPGLQQRDFTLTAQDGPRLVI